MNPMMLAKYEELEQLVRAYNPGADFARLRLAFDFAEAAHGEQLRKDGSPYISHPVATAMIVAEMGLDEDSLIAALLHDCIEDTHTTHEDVAKKFGSDVADIVEGVTKLTRVQYTSKEEEQLASFRKMLMAMARDIRVILIKIADRLHNMRTMEYQTPVKQREKSLETLEVYAPIAHRLGMQRIKWELEDLSMRYLEPVAYEEIRAGLAERDLEDSGFFHKTEDRIRQHLRDGNCPCEVYGRVKHIYSIYRKMTGQNKSFSEVLDLYAFRVVVEDVAECFHALGHIHEIFTPIPGKFKDYISVPKPNGYQSLHTTVLSDAGIPFEVQIRTVEMHRAAEYGVAAHWKYKEGVARNDDDEKFAWIRRLLESQQESDTQDFFNDLKTDMFADEVFVFTPSGDVVNLPAGSTPIDFAYSIHSQVGNRMVGARVNGSIAQYSHVLQNGDIVQIMTSNSSNGPSRDWLKIIKSPEARNKIRQWFKKEKREENIVHGRVSFESELRHANIAIADVMRDDVLPRVLKKLAFPTLDELYAAIGYGGMSAQKAVNRIRDDISLATRERKKDDKDETETIELRPVKRTKPVHGIMVEGLDNCLIKFARCCAPVPGDQIVGFITRGYGVSVHRADCVNYEKSRGNPEEAGRWLAVSWAPSLDDTYSTALAITSRERSGVVMDISTALNAMKVNMTAISARNTGDTCQVFITLNVKNLDDLTAAMSRLSAISGILEVKRAEG
ncbi:MAG: bifunctional (p)ppGpp synthetase/guanosine-3',5'-bis(diphosphate) 3'-pyrophosphohydrolase [Oscillospiraceae bacterium]|jgi:GTP pyrophosphokinase|nr:bifunctional (p)ppGpp synthetase/guanosine-3',5'-bis(diphosphate) 3'-pyrophosphohydrolase [Oscillospiraceae bacterium]